MLELSSQIESSDNIFSTHDPNASDHGIIREANLTECYDAVKGSVSFGTLEASPPMQQIRELFSCNPFHLDWANIVDWIDTYNHTLTDTQRHVVLVMMMCLRLEIDYYKSDWLLQIYDQVLERFIETWTIGYAHSVLTPCMQQLLTTELEAHIHASTHIDSFDKPWFLHYAADAIAFTIHTVDSQVHN
jgi:hypothetical protein